ncbi:hypothetical protein SUGI_0907460 [Cryptomeria japonica]|uniref:protein kinase PINOID 2 n=1 Tax=Cryptomeria japonica TaxID=3369 RepID=UPI0024149C42|nr:protein kinase PINOID 2 [Cryptomeria japonica]GLJ43601.1 hypothetical protein SUGI_0907460 [Cryptomeria japonica]
MGTECDSYDTSFNSISESSFSCVSSSVGLELSSARSSISNDKVVPPLPCNVNKPHKANNAAWEAVRAVRCEEGPIGLNHLLLGKKVGSGDIGKVYMCRLRGFNGCDYAVKVVDKEALMHRNKAHRAEVERQILSTLDHPFLPTLYAHFDASHYSCLLMDYCSGGDLHSLRQRQLSRRFSAPSARFYAAEVVVALEYLHMMGVIYRDLKPENVLVREDGHIMLSDFDLSFRCDVVPTMQPRPAPVPDTQSKPAEPEPVTSCSATGCFFRKSTRSRKSKPKRTPEVAAQPAELVAEPTEARSKSFVGTHEYLAPEVITGKGHGGAVDWWTLGIFLYEMMMGYTPFKGPTKEATLANINSRSLKFPAEKPDGKDQELWESGEDLIKKLLDKDPRRRLGSNRGSADVKRHPFFKDVNWALIRSTLPPGRDEHKSRRSLRRTKSSEYCNRPPHFDYF